MGFLNVSAWEGKMSSRASWQMGVGYLVGVRIIRESYCVGSILEAQAPNFRKPPGFFYSQGILELEKLHG